MNHTGVQSTGWRRQALRNRSFMNFSILDARSQGCQTAKRRRSFEVAQHLTGEVLVNEAAVAEANRFPRDLPLEIALEVDIHGPYHGQRDPAHHAPGRAVIQKPLLHPSGVAELLCHASWPCVPIVGDPACAATPALSCPTHSVNSATRINPLPSHPPWSSCSPRKYQASQAAKAGSSEKMSATRCAGT